MDATVILVLLAIVAVVSIFAGAITGSIDALGQPSELWERAGYRRARWVWQALGVLCLPVAIVYSGSYFARVRPRLSRARRELAVERRTTRPRPGPRVGEPPIAGRADRVRIRMPWSVAVICAAGLLIGLGFWVAVAVIGPPDGTHLPWVQLVTYGAGAVFLTLLNLIFGVTLTPANLVMRGLRRRRVAWSDIVGITTEA